MQGRPNIQILPTPTIDNIIKYFKGFNTFVNQSDSLDNPAKYFDLTPVDVLCQRAARLDSSHGNGKYYSIQNPWRSIEENAKYIPDADGYAFTETRFMDDATERVRSQGGVGPYHQIGSGHETKYYYGKPAQPEIDALFATEVGYASHYSKNMVQDANGQMSISYVDMHGRTIATSLAGDPTEGIDSIINTTDYPLATGTVNNRLITPETNIINGNSIECVNSILVPATTVYNFRYIFYPPILSLLSCTNQEICFDCKYDLEISIKSENCGDTTPIIRRYKNLQIVPANESCDSTMGFTGEGVTNATYIDFSETLGVGSWTIRKTLTINDSMFRVRRDSALKVFLCKTQDSIYDTIYDSLYSASGCGNPPTSTAACDSCCSKLGHFSSYRIKYLNSIAVDTSNHSYDHNIHVLYTQDSLECWNACGQLNVELTTLQSLRNMMLNDMMPFTGQYAIDSVRDTITGIIYPLTDTRLESKYNIFTLTQTHPDYTKPFYINPLNENGQSYYFTEQEEIDSTLHGHVNNQVILESISIQQYSQLFQRSWANSLIKFHPEYTKLQIAEGVLRRSYEWLDSMQLMDNYSIAHSLGFDNPLALPASSSHRDPFFDIAANASEKDTLDKRIRVNVDALGTSSGASIWQIANSTIICASADSLHIESCTMSLPISSKTGMDPSITDTADQNKVWEQFRAMYLGYRNELVLKYINSSAGVLSRIDMDTLLAEGKQLIFANMQDVADQNGAGSWWPIAASGDTTGLADSTATAINSATMDYCTGQRPFWKARLMQCDSLTAWLNNETLYDTTKVNTIINRILDQMVLVCRNSQNLSQPYGASNVNPSYLGLPQNFEQIINFVLDSAGIDTLGHSGYFCNPYTIDFPKPYGHNPQVFINYANTIDSCGCVRFQELLLEAYSQSVDTSLLSSFNNYLVLNYGDTISNTLWQGLKKCKYAFDDSCHTIYNTTCRKPVISSIHFQGEREDLIVEHEYDLLATLCEIFIYNNSNTLVYHDSVDCVDTTTLIEGLDSCRNYRIVFVSTTDSCSKSDTAFYIGCKKPVITNVSIDDSIYISHIPSSCYNSCVLRIYNSANTLIQTTTINCADSLTVIPYTGIRCSAFSFQITTGETETCTALVSDIYYYSPCKKPKILGYSHTDSTFLIRYLTKPCFVSCSLLVRNSIGSLLATIPINCADSIKDIDEVGDIPHYLCDTLLFQIVSSSSVCDTLYSDTFRYNGCCQKPTISSIDTSHIEGHLLINYHTDSSYSDCVIKCYDVNHEFLFQESLDCSDTSLLLEHEIARCRTYYFVISCASTICEERVNSDTLFYNACCPKPVITNVLYNPAGGLDISYGPQPTYTYCSITVIGSGVHSSTSLDCTDSLKNLKLDPCLSYSFQISGYSDSCGHMYSDTFHYSGIAKPVIQNISYNYSNGGFDINYHMFLEGTDCEITVYDSTMTLVTTIPIGCSDTTVFIGSTNPCEPYFFRIGNNSPCSENYSDTAYYNGNCCVKPLIDSVTSAAGLLFINYQTFLSDSCFLRVYDEDNNFIQSLPVECHASPYNYIVPDCRETYHFIIQSFSEYCGTQTSDTFYYNGCDSFVVCTTTFNPIHLSQVVIIPSFLACDYHKPCITCGRLDSLTEEFRLKFPDFAAVPFKDSIITEEQSNQNGLLGRFLNYKTGFSKSIVDYLNAYRICDSLASPLAIAICSFSPPLNDPSDILHLDTLPCRNVETQAQFIAQQLFQSMKDSLIAKFDSLYKAKCFIAKNIEQLYAFYQPKEYHFTLYFYDQAGNLVKTIPPAGVKPNYDPTYLAQVDYHRYLGTSYSTDNNEQLATNYRYNTLNQVVGQMTPDAGISKFWYDKLGRLAISQNAKQITDSNYSYTLYDPLGRITEAGQSTNVTAMSQTISQDTAALSAWINDISAETKKQITLTMYDIPYTALQVSVGNLSGLYQKNLRNRVSYSMVFDDEVNKAFLLDGTVGGGNSATYYSYDIHGNVDTLMQDYNVGMGEIPCDTDTSNRFKKIVYDYDLISGKVNDVAYQPGQRDQFYHRYEYDADNRITSVRTSRDKLFWERDANYSYYRHGPLSRMILGENQVQGLDYAYTIQGWLKGVNSTGLYNGLHDIGHDGKSATINRRTGRDAFGFSLNYFNGDYKPIDNSVAPFATIDLGSLPADVLTGKNVGSELFNGNIAAMAVNIPKIGDSTVYGYRYDQLNRLVKMDAFNGLENTTNSFSAVRTDDYHEEISYDPNGNIRTYKRNGSTATSNQSMDQLEYFYNHDIGGKLINNKLRHVTDAVTAHTDDLGSQVDDNYEYDAIGNLVKDSSEGISNIEWTVYGKIKRITKTDATIEYTYDATGNRISKIVTDSEGTKSTYYIRDASGNVMSLYQGGFTDINSGELSQTEMHLYGSSRLGINNTKVNVQCVESSDDTTNFVRGNKFFELSNHLGNVLATLSDKKIGHDSGADSIDYNIADVVTANDYYPGGSLIPGRKFSSGNLYRYGFNGKENDNDVKGEGNQQDYGMRIYDSRLVRFLSVDPLAPKYPELTPYQFASNTPIQAIDLDGLEMFAVNPNTGESASGPLNVLNFKAKDGWIVGSQTQQQSSFLTPAEPTYNRNIAAVHSEAPPPKPQSIRPSTSQGPVISQYRQPDPACAEQNKNIANAYKATHPEPTKLEQNKTFQKFAENLAMPMIEAAPFAKGAQSLLKGARLLFEGADITVYRVFGGESPGLGKSWTPINPGSVTNYRNLAGLPNVNTGRFVIQGTVKESNILLKRSALRADGNIGGLPEFIIENPEKIKLKSVSGVNPAF